jgi:hypothetical protein
MQKRKRNEDAKTSSPAETPAEATYNMLKRKVLNFYYYHTIFCIVYFIYLLIFHI